MVKYSRQRGEPACAVGSVGHIDAYLLGGGRGTGLQPDVK